MREACVLEDSSRKDVQQLLLIMMMHGRVSHMRTRVRYAHGGAPGKGDLCVSVVSCVPTSCDTSVCVSASAVQVGAVVCTASPNDQLRQQRNTPANAPLVTKSGRVHNTPSPQQI